MSNTRRVFHRLRRLSRQMPLGLAMAALSGLAAAQESSAPKTATPEIPLNIESQPLPGALRALAAQTGLQLIYHTEEIDPRLRSPAVSGTYTADKALTKMLDKSGLAFYRVNAKTIAIQLARSDGQKSDIVSPPASTVATHTSDDGAEPQQTAKEDTGQKKIQASADNTQNDARRKDLDEVVVTAQKRDERLQDVPVPVTAITADSLVENNQLRLQDYYTRVPGLSVSSDGGALSTLAIRGITTGGFGNPTVAIAIDDVPFSSATTYGDGLYAPDVDPSDLARIEVLRGPQGTLYGASSLGGLLKYVTVDPSTERVSGRLQAGTDSVYNGAELGYSVRGAVNLPITETTAIRASGFTRRDPGYIDDPTIGVNGINRHDVYGGRLSGLWKPSEQFSLKLAAMFQNTHSAGWDYAHQLPGLRDLQQSTPRGTGWDDQKYQLYSATASAKLGRSELTSVSGYYVNTSSLAVDLSELFGVPGWALGQENKTTKFSQEVRLLTPLGERFDWLLGGFYTYETGAPVQRLIVLDSATGRQTDLLGDVRFPNTFTEYAIFTDLTVRVTDRFDVQFGGRESQNRQAYQSFPTGFLGTTVGDKKHSKDNAFTYLVTPRFRMSPNLMVYARLASGYRAGGPNTSGGPGIPSEFGSDKTQNYEVGVKGDVLERVLSFDASVYYIDWRDIQLSLFNGVGYFVNGGRAKSQGVELSVDSHPLNGLTISAWVSYNDAKLTEDLPATSTVYGVSGDRLPLSSRVSGNLAIDQRFPLTTTVAGSVGASVSYVGDRKGIFMATPERQDYPGYAKVDLRAGLRYESWTADLFINNVADRRGTISGGLGAFLPYAIGYIQPRMVGVSLSKRF